MIIWVFFFFTPAEAAKGLSIATRRSVKQGMEAGKQWEEEVQVK